MGKVGSSGGSNSVKLWDGQQFASIDKLGFLGAIEIEHHFVHAEEFYTTGDFKSGIGAGEIANWLLVTPDSEERFHTKVALISSTAGKGDLYENPVVANNGQALTIYNNDRNSSNTTTLKAYYGPTITAGNEGGLLETQQMGGGTKSAFGDEARSPAEWILKQDSKYLVRFTGQNADTFISFNTQFYNV